MYLVEATGPATKKRNSVCVCAVRFLIRVSTIQLCRQVIHKRCGTTTYTPSRFEGSRSHVMKTLPSTRQTKTGRGPRRAIQNNAPCQPRPIRHLTSFLREHERKRRLDPHNDIVLQDVSVSRPHPVGIPVIRRAYLYPMRFVEPTCTSMLLILDTINSTRRKERDCSACGN